MAVSDTPFQRREIFAAAYAGTGATDKEKLQMQAWLDIRDLLSRISVIATEGKAEIVSPEDMQKKQEEDNG